MSAYFTKNKPKVALVADWLTSVGGAESVVGVFHEMFPDAPIFTSVYDNTKHDWLNEADVRTSFLQKVPFAKKHHQWFIKLMPYAFEQMDLNEFDLVISSSHSCAKGVITRPDTLHVSYCHTPMRYVWESHHDYIQRYLNSDDSSFLTFLAKYQLHRLRTWDRIAADRVDVYLANSNCVANRIRKYYRRDAHVVHPPVNLGKFSNLNLSGKYFLAIGRLISYKRFDLLIEAFNKSGLPLKIVGEGREYANLKKMSLSNIEFAGFVKDSQLNHVYSMAKAVLFPQYEDFGIVPLEAMACGKPVIAYNKGGVAETVLDGKTGIMFNDQTVSSLSDAIDKFNQTDFDSNFIAEYAQNFSTEKFKQKIYSILNHYIPANVL